MSRRSTRIASQRTVTHYHKDGHITKVNQRDEILRFAASIKYHLDGADTSHGLRAKMHHVNACFSIIASSPDMLARYPRFAETTKDKALELINQTPAGFTRAHVILRRAIEVVNTIHP
jgi:hypothetical protein